MRLIDADAIIEVMQKCAENPENAQALLCYRYAQRILEEAPTVEPSPPWHRVEDGLPEMSEIVPGYVCSEILVLYDAESKYADIGYVREKPDNNGVDWLWGKPRKNPTHWMYFKPPKEDA